MKQRYLHATSLLSLLLILILSGCGGENAASTTAKGTLIISNEALSAVNAANGSQLWSFSEEPERGFSTPFVVSANRFYWNSTKNGISNSTLAALDLTNGKKIWSTSLPKGSSILDVQATSTMVYVHGYSVLSAFDATSGVVKWSMNDVGFGLRGNGIGEFIISGNTIYTVVSKAITALDATTGSRLWQFTPPSLQKDVTSISLSPDGKTLVIAYYIDPFSGNALYAVHTDSHQEAWHLDPSVTKSGSTSRSMSLYWFRITPDNHVPLSASLDSGPQYRYLSLSDGSMAWSLPLSNQDLPFARGGVLIDNGTLYTISGESQKNISATTLSNQQQAWKVPSSSSYEHLYLNNGILLAWSDSNSNPKIVRGR